MLTKENLNETLADAVMNRPREFFIGKKRYCLWSPSLGQTIMLERHLSGLDISSELLQLSPNQESLRLISEKRIRICNILAILSFKTLEDLSDSRKIRDRSKEFANSLSDNEIAQLLLLILSDPKVETAIELSGIKKEHEEQSRIAKHKNSNGHTRTYGGKTIYGSLIDVACKSYGWTKEYVVWGIDLFSLRMMLSDAVNNLYLSDDDMKAMHIVAGEVVDANDPANIARFKSMDWS